MSGLTLGSLFDGSGGFPLGGLLSGITPVWASEIEPFPIRVTTKRLPFVKHYGDISRMDGGKIEPVDIITFGSPCTDMSIAGRRAGLDGQQSVLFYQAIRIIKEMRCATDGRYPRWICWENVTGAFSSNSGRDFKAVLEAVIGIVEPEAEVPPPGKDGWPYADCYLGDGWSVAYRTLDACGWGVPQRRRRIYLVADLAGGSAGQVLFESEGVSGYSPESFRAWQRTARGPAACAGAPGCLVRSGAVALENHAIDGRIKIEPDNTVQTLTSRMGTGGMNVPLLLKVRCGCEGGGKGALIQEDISATISCNNDQTLFQPKVYGICSDQSHSMLSDNPHSGIYEADTTRTLDANGGNPGCNQGGMAVVEGTPVYSASKASYFTAASEELANALVATDYKDPPLINEETAEYTVRRLTPTECARLQGFPDWWCSGLETPEPTMDDLRYWYDVFETHRKLTGSAAKPKTLKQIVKWLRDPHTDAAEYKMWGNGVALPCVIFVLSGIVYYAQN